LYTVDAAFNTLYDALHKSVLDFVPECTFTDSKFPPWFDKSLKNILFLKKKAHIKFKTSSNAHDYREYSLLRARFKYESKICLQRHFKRIESSLISNPGGNSLKTKRSLSAIPKEVSYRGTTSTNEQEAEYLFSMYFSSVFSDNQLNLDTSSLGIKSFDLPNNVNFTIENVYKHLTDLHGKWSIGPDGLSGEYLYQLRNIITVPLWTLFKRSLEEPSFLKLSSVTPVYKSGELSNVSNYRPISIQLHISKIFELLVLHCIQPSINKILMEEQHGFRPGRSTITCI